MSLRSGVQALTTGAAQAVANSTHTVANLRGASLQDTVPLVLHSTGPWYYGSSAITSASGIPVKADVSVTFNLLNSDPLFAKSTVTGETALRILAGRQQGGTTAAPPAGL